MHEQTCITRTHFSDKAEKGNTGVTNEGQTQNESLSMYCTCLTVIMSRKEMEMHIFEMLFAWQCFCENTLENL